MRKNLFFVLIIFPFFSFTSIEAKSLSLADFQEKMKKQINKTSPKTKVAIHVEVLGQKQEIYSYSANNEMIPASAIKLITAQVALDSMGPGYTYQTKVFVDGSLDGDTVNGNIILQGNGDPFLVSERLWLLARDLSRKGIRKITGGIKINNTAFHSDYRDLLEFNRSGEPFAAIVSATSLNFNSLEMHIVPTALGANARTEIGPLPHEYLHTLHGGVKTVLGKNIAVEFSAQMPKGNREIFKLSGTIGRDAPAVIKYASVALPASHLSYAFAALLKAEGISLASPYLGISTENIEKLGKAIAVLDSLPLHDLVRLYNTYSNNFMAEQVFQSIGSAQLGAPATLDKSRQVINLYLKQFKNCASAIVDNGSGLSWSSRINAKCFVEMMQNSYRDFRIFADLLGSLPVGGQTGTLKNRFKRLSDDFDPTKVRAKTGTLWSKKLVSSLVGFTQTQSGETLVFSILQNDERNDPGRLRALKDWEDSCIELMQELKL